MYIYKHMFISHHKNAAQTLLKTVFPGSCDVETNYPNPGSSEVELSSSIFTDILFRIIEKLQIRKTLEVIWTNTLLKVGPHKCHLDKNFFPPTFFFCAGAHVFPRTQAPTEQWGSPTLSQTKSARGWHSSRTPSGTGYAMSTNRPIFFLQGRESLSVYLLRKHPHTICISFAKKSVTEVV